MLKRLSVQTIIAAVVFFLVIIFLFFDPLTHPEKSLAGHDFKLANIHWKNFAVYELKHGRIPLWNPFINSGQPFLAHPESSLFYPPNLLYLAVPVPYAMTILIAFHVWIALLFMYKLVSYFVKDTLPAVASGVTYALSGYFAGKIFSGHLNSIISASLFPLILYFFVVAMHSPTTKNIIKSIVAFSLLILAGFPENTIYFVLFTTIFLSLMYRKKIIIVVILLACIYSVSGLLTSVQLTPSLEYARLTTRAQGMDYKESVIYSMTKQELPNLINRSYYTSSIPQGPTAGFHEYLNYLGIISLGAAIMAVLIAILRSFLVKKNKLNTTKHSVTIILTLLAVVGFLVSFGDSLPYHIYEFLWTYIPLFRLFRIPSHYLLFTLLSVSILSGLGLSYFKSTAVKLAIVLTITIDLVFFMKPFITTDTMPTYPTNPQLIRAFELFDKTYRFYHTYGVYTSWYNLLWIYDTNTSLTQRIESTRGYDTMILKRYGDFTSAIDGRTIVPFSSRPVDVELNNVASPLFNLLSPKYVFTLTTDADLQKQYPEQFKTIEQNRDYTLYENKRAFPKGTILHTIIRKNNASETLSYMTSNEFKPENELVVTDKEYSKLSNISGPPVSAEKVTIVSRLPNKTVFTVETKKDGVLLITDIAYPGWMAKVDSSSPVPVATVDFLFQGVRIPSGNHTVTVYFSPMSVKIGLAISTLTMLTLLILWRFSDHFDLFISKYLKHVQRSN